MNGGASIEVRHYAIITTIIIQSIAGHLTCPGMITMTSARGSQGTDLLL